MNKTTQMDLQIKEAIDKAIRQREDEMANIVIDHSYLSWEEVRTICRNNTLILQKHPEIYQRITDLLDEGENLLNGDHDSFTQIKYLAIKDAIVADLEILNDNRKLRKAS
jgi:hypothetical protein